MFLSRVVNLTCNCTDRRTQLFFPHFILFPSTTTLISACYFFVVGISMLCYHNRDDIWQDKVVTGAFIVTIATIRWKCVLPSLQNLLAINIWSGVAGSAFCHLILRWIAPGYYAAIVESNKMQAEEAKRKELQRDVEGEVPGEPRVVTSLEGEQNEETPLTG
jgi:hypothetical protein